MMKGLRALQSLSFAQRIALLPGIAGAGFALIVIVSLLLGWRSTNRLDLVERGYAPSLAMSRDLNELLAEYQRTMQDAVAALDESMLTTTDSLAQAFAGRLQAERNNPVLEAAELDGLDQQFEKYAATSRRTAEQLIAGMAGDNMFVSLQTMTQQYNGLRDAVAGMTIDKQAAMTVGLTTARASQRTTLVTIVIVTVLAVAVLSVLSLVIFRMVTRPLGQLSEGFSRMASGNFRTLLRVESNDEIGTLSEQANHMMGSLGELLGAVVQASRTVAEAADELSASSMRLQRGAEHQSSSSEETSSAMVEMATQIDQVAKAAAELAVTVEETTAAVQQMATNSQQVAGSSEALVSTVEETAATMEQMAAQIETVAGRVRVVEEVSRTASETVNDRGRELSSVIRGIGDSSQNIGKIVGIIEEIADQTNLLALNAAIEAARAGEVGRGFAVVADEVRRLAERSVDSIREVGRVVESVQGDTSQAVRLTDAVLAQITDSVTRTSELVAEVHQATEEQSRGAAQIVKATATQQEIATQLAHAAREQSNGAESILQSVETMNAMTQQVADATREQKRGGDLIVKSTEEITDIARQTVEASGQLGATMQSLVSEAETLRTLSLQFEV